MAGAQVDRSGRTFLEQHRENLARRAVAEELAQRFFVIADTMALDHRDEVALGVAAERGFAEMRIGGEKALGRDLEVGEVAASAAGDQNFRARLRAMLEQQHAPAAPPRAHRAHHPGRAGAQHDDVERFHQRRRRPSRSRSGNADRAAKFA